MDIINRYFNFKKRNLLEYISIFFNDKDSSKKYLQEFIDTYINTYYFHILDTYYEEEVNKFDDKIIIKEIKGKRLELIDNINNIEDEKTRRKETKLINECYKYCFIAIIIDLTNFTYCNKLSDYRDTLKRVLIENKGLLENNDEVLEKLSVLLKDSINKERKFFIGLRNDTFNINYYSYKNSNKNYKVVLEFNINQLEKNYSKNVLEKNYKNEKVSLEKFNATVNLVEIDLLNKILRNKKIDNYFIECPLSSIKKREDLEETIKRFNNPRIRDRVVFTVNYSDYTSNKSMLKNLKEFNFALLVDLSRVIIIEKRLAEIESFDIFKYIIINGIKRDNYQLIENYVMKDKEMFMNELNMM